MTLNPRSPTGILQIWGCALYLQQRWSDAVAAYSGVAAPQVGVLAGLAASHAQANNFDGARHAAERLLAKLPIFRLALRGRAAFRAGCAPGPAARRPPASRPAGLGSCLRQRPQASGSDPRRHQRASTWTAHAATRSGRPCARQQAPARRRGSAVRMGGEAGGRNGWIRLF